MRAVVIHAEKDLRIDTLPDEAAMDADQVRVKIEAGGICGSDLHYYQHGGFGAIRVREPMVLGHEIAGRVLEVGKNVTHVAPGDHVAVNPSRPCNACTFCLRGMQMHCLDMRFYGSAMRFPHVQGGFREMLVCDAPQAVKVPKSVSTAAAAFGEPLAVCLHGVNRAGPLLGKRVLITGCGPIGLLAMLAARHAGAGEIVCTDIAPNALAMAKKMGADDAINTASGPEALARFTKDKGYFDVMFEASGNQHALVGAFTALKPRAIIVQLGIGENFSIPISVLVAKEFDLRGTFRFQEEFQTAVDAIASGRIDVMPLLTETMPVDKALDAFHLAADKSRAIKVQLSF
ncbi:MAG: L-idonate 5-dehydrogenase [Beijerinckiaceae bacterium]